MNPSESKANKANEVVSNESLLTGSQKGNQLIKQGIFSLGHFTVDIYMNLLPPIMPMITKNLGLSLALAATVLSAKSITASFLQPYLGYLIDKKQNKWLLPLSIIWVTVTMGLVGVVDNYYLLLLVSALSGIGSAVYHPLGSTYTNIFASENKGLAVSIFSTGGNLGFSIGPVIVMPVVLYFGLKGTLLLMIPGLVVAILFILFNIYYLGDTAQEKVKSEKSVIKEKTKRLPALKEKMAIWNSNHRLVAVIVLNVIVILRSTVHAGMVAFLPYYFLKIGYSDIISGRLLSLFLLSGALSGIFGGYISDRYGRKIVTVVSMISAAVLLIVTLYTAGNLSLAFLILTGGMLLLSVPVTIIYAQEIIPENKGLASGLMMGFCYGIAGLTITPLGIVADIWGIKAVMGLFSILLIMGALLFLMISRLTRNNYAG